MLAKLYAKQAQDVGKLLAHLVDLDGSGRWALENSERICLNKDMAPYAL